MPVTSPRSSNLRGYPRLRTFIGPGEIELKEWVREAAETVNSARDGKLNSVGSLTLRANETTTTLSDPRIGPNSHISLTPTSATAAAAVGSATGVFVTPGDETATITHNSTADADRTFTYAILG